MDRERWQRIEELMQEALDLPADERAPFLDRECDGDATLRSEVDRLLALGDEEFSVIERPAVELAAVLLVASQPARRAGERFGRYEILDLLGTGGMGEVYLARDTLLERNVALKLLPDDYTADPERVRRFRQEARAASALNHPNIITIYEMGEHEGHQFIAAEYVVGETLRRRMTRGRIGAGEALEVAIQAAGALAAAHRAGIIHRDVKPENVMLRPDGYVKVLDFGLAKLVEQDALAGDLSVTTPGLVMGTVRYMSPEQARALELDARTDVFSLGVVLYEMLAGVRPFDGETASDVVAEILKVEPPPVTSHAEGAPEALDHVLGRALAKKRDERYGSAGELLADLKSLAREIDLRAEWTRLQTDSGAAASLATSGARTAQTAEQSSATWRRVREATATGFHTAFGTPKRGAAVSMVLLGAVLAPATFFVQQTRSEAPFDKVTIRPLGGDEVFGFAAVSPDGRYIVEAGEGKAEGFVGFWVRERATGNAVRVADTRHFLHQPVFSSDSSHFYYNDAEYGPGGEGPKAIVMLRVPTLGGEPEEVLRDPWSNLAPSPDGARIAYARTHPDETTTLCVANADGSGERVIASRAPPESFTRGGPAWSPDGTLVACGTKTGLVLVPADGGEERVFRSEEIGGVKRVVWPVTGGGMVVTNGQLWHLSYPGLEPRRITNDFENYEALSATDDATTIVSTWYGRVSNLWVASGQDAPARQITRGKVHGFAKVRWTPDGRIVGPANTSGRRELWIMDADGSNRRQLTNGMNVYVPAVSPDGRWALFASIDADNRYFVWRIGLDGSDPTRLAEGHSPSCTPDGWVFFMGMGESGSGLRKVRIEGGEVMRVTERNVGPGSISPDGKYLLCAHWPVAEGPHEWVLLSTETGRIVRRLDGPRGQWSPDGRGWLEAGPDGSGTWLVPLGGGPREQLSALPPAGTVHWEWSADGKLVYVTAQDYAENVVVADAE